MSAILPFLQVAGTAFSFISKISSANAQARQNEEKAYEAFIKGRTDAVAYREEGLRKFEEMRRAMSANIARGSAGGLDPFAAGETIDLLNLNNLSEGGQDWKLARNNAEMAILMGNRQSMIYQDAAASNRTYGYLGAVADLSTSTATIIENRYPTESTT